MAKLNNGILTNGNFFYREMSVADQALAAELIGKHIGLNNILSKSEKEISLLYDEACWRLGVLKAAMVKKLFFCGHNFIESVNYISRSVTSYPNKTEQKYFAYFQKEIKWEEFDSIADDLAFDLKNIIEEKGLIPKSPIKIIYEKPSFKRDAESVSFKIGLLIDDNKTKGKLGIEPYLIKQHKEWEHKGSFVNLEEIYKGIIDRKQYPSRIEETYHAFYGARSMDNLIKINSEF